MQMLPPHINQNVSAYAELGRKPYKASTNKECSKFWANEVFELRYLSSKHFCNKTGGLAINLDPKLNKYARFKFFKNS